jgi:hypothetical protein
LQFFYVENTLTCRDKNVVTCKLCLITNGSVTCKTAVTVILSLNFIIGCWGYTLIERTELVRGETIVTDLHSI